MQPLTWKPPITTGTSGCAEVAREIERARILVRLHADQADEAAAGFADVAHDALDVDDGVALVIGFDVDIDIGTEHVVLGAFASAGHRRWRDCSTEWSSATTG